jgi:hypothetical protein
MLVTLKSGADFSRGCVGELISHSILTTHPPTASRIDSRPCQPRERRTGLEEGAGAVTPRPVNSRAVLPRTEKVSMVFAA